MGPQTFNEIIKLLIYMISKDKLCMEFFNPYRDVFTSRNASVYEIV